MYLNNALSKQSGIGLPVVLFIITIMSLIAAAVNQMSVTSSQSYSQNILSSRAFYAAESGVQLRAQETLSTQPCNCGGSADVEYDFTVTGLNQCGALTRCTSFIANGDTFCTISSIGRCDNANAERTVEVRLK
ncbi:MAG: MSHA biogenesis protein MshP [Oleispira sp.]|jgi:MSHA biogenesis protein MshP